MFRIAINNLFEWLFSRVLASYRSFDSRPGHVSPGTSSLGWRWPWSSLFIHLLMNICVNGNMHVYPLCKNFHYTICRINQSAECTASHQEQENKVFWELTLLREVLYIFHPKITFILDQIHLWRTLQGRGHQGKPSFVFSSLWLWCQQYRRSRPGRRRHNHQSGPNDSTQLYFILVQ